MPRHHVSPIPVKNTRMSDKPLSVRLWEKLLPDCRGSAKWHKPVGENEAIATKVTGAYALCPQNSISGNSSKVDLLHI